MFGGSQLKASRYFLCVRSSPETPLTCVRSYLSNPAYTFYWLGLSCPIVAVMLILLGGTLGFCCACRSFLCGYRFVYTTGISLFLLGAGLTLSMFTLFYAYNLALSDIASSNTTGCNSNSFAKKAFVASTILCFVREKVE